jgi:hypothetical protein
VVFSGVTYDFQAEAVWAAFMTALGWKYTYRPVGPGGCRCCSFLIHGNKSDVAVFITTAETEDELIRIKDSISEDVLLHWKCDVLVATLAPVLMYNEDGISGMSLGLLGEAGTWWDVANPTPPGQDPALSLSWGAAVWNSCGKCGQTGFVHSDMSFKGRPCGDWDGDGYLNDVVDQDLIRLWNVAGKAVENLGVHEVVLGM